MPKFTASLNLPQYATAPASPANGDVYYNTTDSKVYSRISGAWVDLAASAGGGTNLVQNQQTGTTYSLVAGDLGKLVELSNAAAITVTVPANILAAGDQINIMQTGAGQVTVAAGTNVSAVNSALGLKLRAQWSSATLIKRVTSNNADVWVLVGDTTT